MKKKKNKEININSFAINQHKSRRKRRKRRMKIQEKKNVSFIRKQLKTKTTDSQYTGTHKAQLVRVNKYFKMEMEKKK